MKTIVKLPLLLASLMLVSTAIGISPEPKNSADLIYINATVETMDANSSTAQAIAIRDGIILAVGSNDAIMAYKGPTTNVKDATNETILPGFFDSHSHMLGIALYRQSKWVDVSSMNVLLKPLPGDSRCKKPKDYQQCFIPVQTQDDVIQRLQDAIASQKSSPASPILAANYDPSRLGHSQTCQPSGAQGFQCPNFEDGNTLKYLDPLSATHPILVTSESGHIVYVNSIELKKLNICGVDGADAHCYNPIYNSAVETTLAKLGQLDEDLAVLAMTKVVAPDWEQIFNIPNDLKDLKGQDLPAILKMPKDVKKLKDILKMPRAAAQAYASQGFTTIQEGAADWKEVLLYEWLTSKPDFPVGATILLYGNHSPDDQAMDNELKFAQAVASLKNPNLTIAAIKLFADGSTQGYTASMLQPYAQPLPPYIVFNPPIVPQPYQGLPDLPETEIRNAAEKIHLNGFPVAVHQNGDGAITNTLQALQALKSTGPVSGRHDLMIHFSRASTADLAAAQSLDAGVTFLMENLYYYGLPLCQQVIGPDQARRLYPAGDAVKNGLRFALHSDTPVTPAYPLFAIWVAKTRATQQPSWYKNQNEKQCPVKLGPEQAITIRQGIKAYTIDAAWMYGLDNKLGSLESGKVADLVILSDDPLTMEDVPDRLKTIRVLGTVHRGKYFANPKAKDSPIWPE